MTFHERQSSMLNALQCNTTFAGEKRDCELEGFLTWSLKLKAKFCIYWYLMTCMKFFPEVSYKFLVVRYLKIEKQMLQKWVF